LALKPVSLNADNFKGAITDSYARFLRGVYALGHPRFFRPVCQTNFGNEVIDDSVDLRRRDTLLAYRPTNTGLPVLT